MKRLAWKICKPYFNKSPYCSPYALARLIIREQESCSFIIELRKDDAADACKGFAPASAKV